MYTLDYEIESIKVSRPFSGANFSQYLYSNEKYWPSTENMLDIVTTDVLLHIWLKPLKYRGKGTLCLAIFGQKFQKVIRGGTLIQDSKVC